MLNGAVIKGVVWRQVTTDIVNNTYSTAPIQVSTGTSTFTHKDSSVMYGSIQYGLSTDRNGYAFLGGLQATTIISYHPRIIQHPKSVNIIYGKTLTLQCNGTSSPIANVTWLKDGNPLTSYDDIKLILNFYVYSRLTISNITTQDEGLYQCRYDNIIGSITSEVATVTIYDSETAHIIGREFHFGYLDIPRSASIPYTVITALNKSTGINITNNHDKTSTLYNISSYNSLTITLTNKLEITESGVTSKTLYITSDEDITVACYYGDSTAQTAYSILPSQFYGKEYIVAMYRPSFYGQILMTSNDNDTQVEISFPHNTVYNGQTYSQNRNLTITLQRNQGFYFHINQDLTGTIIYSNNNIAVLAGNICSTIKAGSCEPLVQHYMPIKFLGKNYILSTLTGVKAGSIFRVVAAYNNTKVRLNFTIATYELLRGGFAEFELSADTDAFLTCDYPCLVIQFAIQSFGSTGNDPFMNIVPAIEQYSRNLVVSVSPTIVTNLNFARNYVLITIQDKYKDGLMLNGAVIKGVVWRQVTTDIVNNTYSTAPIQVSTGTSTFTHKDSSVMYGSIQYGLSGNRNGYAFLGGLQVTTIISCK
ncbi:IgGFc-binding protein [Trichoplax sp. H2]|nr:IgGFc-binding protein [Trichoplax sp. H2]|eukprot:RDD35924.1 IgGFc-binding protein [Trichoplax sp. H2]